MKLMNGIRSLDGGNSPPMPPPGRPSQAGPAFSLQWVSLALAVCGFVALFLADLISPDISLLAEGPPIFSGLHITRTCVIAACSGLLVWFLSRPDTRISRPWTPAWMSWGTVRWVSPEPDERFCWSMSAKRLSVWAVMALSAGMVLVFLWSPSLFYKLGKEDHPVEIFSAGALFLNSILFLLLAPKLHQHLDRQKLLGVLVALAFAFTFFLIGMEEVSWFQRQLEVETPASFSENMQGELNLHNFATDEIETLYYLAAFTMLVLFPFISHVLARWAGKSSIKVFVPPPFLAYAGAMTASFNYDMWNTLPTQAAFFVSVFILVYHLTHHSATLPDTLTNISVLVFVIAAQVVFIATGDRFVRLHDVTEYKELLIPISFLIYAGNLLLKAGIPLSGGQPPPATGRLSSTRSGGITKPVNKS